MHEDLDTPGPAELEQLADNEAGEGRMPNCQHFRRLARKWREDREDRDALRHALLQATTEKARARRAELQPTAERIAYAVALQGDHGITLAPLCKAPACAIEALSPFEGAAVVGLATIAVEAEAVSGMQYRLKHVGAAPQHGALPHTVPVRDAIHGTVEVTKVFPGDVVAEERDLQAGAPVDALRAKQAEAVMPLLGPLLDAWDRVHPDDTVRDSGIADYMEPIQQAMEHGDAPSAPVGVEALLQRIDAAIERVTTGRAAMRVPAELTDPDLVLADARNWIKQAALAQQLAAADDNAEQAEPCESGLPDCGPAAAWDSDGVGACDRCAKELGWIAGQQQGGTPE